MTTLTIETHSRSDMVEVTRQVEKVVTQSGVRTGTVMVYVPHTTAGCTINENADPDVQHDMLLTFDELVPKRHEAYRHAEGNSDAHVKASIVGFSQTVLIEQGRLVLGTWQGIYLVEFDGPRRRSMHVRVTAQ